MPTLKQAAKAAKVNQLNSLGTSKGAFDSGNLLNAVEITIGNFIKRIQRNIEGADMIVSGRISDITTRRNGNTIEVLAYPELIYQDKGVNGSKVKKYNTPFSYSDKRPPVEPFIDWVKRKPLTIKKGSTVEGAAYAVREKVFQEGFGPRNIYSKEIPKLIKDLKIDTAKAGVSEIKKGFNNG